jgi:hypothetical protein
MSRNAAASEFWRRTITTAGVIAIERINLEDDVIYRFATAGLAIWVAALGRHQRDASLRFLSITSGQ